jgi:hypothetical protein
MELKTYEATFKDDSDGVFAISLVNDPATQETFIALSSQEIKLAEVDKEQRIVMGLVLQPDQLIYRNQGGEEFNIVFKADTIKELSHNFFKSGYQLNSKMEHSEPIKGVSFVESWIVENPDVDKSTNFGFSYPKGSWMATMKIDNDEVWNDYVKTGKVQGFSVDAMVDLKEVNLKSNIKMAEEKKTFSEQVNEVLVSLGLVKEEVEVKFGSVMSGDVKIDFEGEDLEVGTPVYVLNEEERVPLPDAEYPLEDGRTLVAKDGMVESVGEAPQEEPEQEVAAAEPSTPSVSDATDAVQAIKSLLIKYSEEADAKIDAKFEEINKSLVALNSENEKLKNEVVELSKQPAEQPIKEVKQVELTATGRLLQSLRNNK